jgi:hypothetical protein
MGSFNIGRNILKFLLETAEHRLAPLVKKQTHTKIKNAVRGSEQFVRDKLTRTKRIDAMGNPAVQPKFKKIVEDVRAAQRIEDTKKAQRDIAERTRMVHGGKKPTSPESKKQIKDFAKGNVRAVIRQEGGTKRLREAKKFARKLDKIARDN